MSHTYLLARPQTYAYYAFHKLTPIYLISNRLGTKTIRRDEFKWGNCYLRPKRALEQKIYNEGALDRVMDVDHVRNFTTY